jgi:hypothetical protein
MKLISDELYELMMDNIESKDVREQVFAEAKDIDYSDRDALCSALETDVNYWESCLKAHPNDKPEILRHVRNYIACDKELMKVFAR